MDVCKFFLQSRCTKGTSCSFRHEHPGHQSAAYGKVRSASGNGYGGSFERSQQGAHRTRKDNSLTHGTLRHQALESQPRVEGEVLGDSRSLVPCKYYMQSRCAKGTSCPYMHTAEADHGTQRAEENVDPEIEHDSFRRTISGSLVQFQQGGSVSKVSLASEFAAVRLDGFPADDNPTTIHGRIREIDNNIAVDAVCLLSGPDRSTTSALITVEDPNFANTFIEKLKVKQEHDKNYAHLRAISAPPRLPSWAATKRISCNKVLISWHRPSRFVWLNFGQHSIAKRVSDKFNKGQYKIRGQIVNADSPIGGESSSNRMAFTVLLQNAPHNTTQADVRESITDEYNWPRHIELGAMAGSYDVEAIPTFVESVLSRIGPVEFSMLVENRGKRNKAVAYFNNECDAREAVDSLHDKPQRFLNNSKLYMQLMSSSKFKVSTNIYKSVESEIIAHVPEWHEQHIALRVYPDSDPQKRFVTLKIEGEQAKDVAKAASTAEAILAGKTIEDGSSHFWRPELGSNGVAFRKLKSIEHAFGVTIIRSKTKRQLKYFGPCAKFVPVQKSVIEELSTEPSSVHVIRLSDTDFAWACRGGFNRICSVLGGDVVSLDVVSMPKRILVTGSEEQYQQALTVVRREQDQSASQNVEKDEQDCEICWTPAEDPVTLACGHLYCLDCFERLCMSGDSAGSDFSVQCQGELGKCGRVLSLQDLQAHLSSAALEDMLEASFTSYIRRRPQEFRYCPTPDCGFIYRATSQAKNLTCTKCLEVICRACHQQHGLLSCNEYNDLVHGGHEAFERFKKAMKIKDCPSCRTPIEKTEGCNHITCGGCGVHICWVCLKTFATGAPVYAHMNALHGGIGLDIMD